MTQTINEQLTLERLRDERRLQRIERANPEHYRFARETPRHQRHIPFLNERERVELRDAVIGLVAFAGLVAALVTAPWWLT